MAKKSSRGKKQTKHINAQFKKKRLRIERRSKQKKPVKSKQRDKQLVTPQFFKDNPFSFVFNIIPKNASKWNKRKATILNKLTQDFKYLMSPNTAEKLQVTANDKISAIYNKAKVNNISYLISFRQTEFYPYMNIARMAYGPTITFQISSFALMKTILKYSNQIKPEQSTAVAIFSNFTNVSSVVDDPQKAKSLILAGSLLQDMFPRVKLGVDWKSKYKRVVMFYYNDDQDIIEMRQYAIRFRKTISKRIKHMGVKNLDMSKMDNLANYMTKYNSDSDASSADDETNKIEYVTFKRGTSDPVKYVKKVSLREIGPRMSMRLFRVVEGVFQGQTLYSSKNEKNPSKQTKDDQ